jgi:RNA-directed DNA polymerase
MLWKWAKRRYPNKPISWVLNKYFEKNRYGEFEVFKGLYRVDKTHIVRYIKVRGKASPDDPTLKKYWEDRRRRISKVYFAKGSKLYLIAESQSWKCNLCANWLMNGEEIDIHHIIPISQGGNDDISNLKILHESCHYQEHSNGKGDVGLRVD